VRWGLRTGRCAWPDRSTPAPAMCEFALDAIGLSSPRVGGFGMASLPQLRRFHDPDGVLRGLRLRTEVLDLRGISRCSWFRLRERRGRSELRGGRPSRKRRDHRGHGSPPRASRVNPGGTGRAAGLDRAGGEPITRTTRGRSSIATDRATGRPGRAPRAALLGHRPALEPARCGDDGDDASPLIG
jgi:hypothetical protein